MSRADRAGRDVGVRVVSWGGPIAIVALLLAHDPAAARSLTDVFRSPQFRNLGLASLGPALASTVASTYPVASASSSVVYTFDPALDTPRLRPGPLGPILGERAETIRERQLDFAINYSFVELTSIDGESLDGLVNQRLVNGRFLFFPVPGGVTLRDGRVTTFLPVRVSLDLGVRAHIVAPSFTYGLTPDLDVNLTVPIVHTSLDVQTRTRVPDPRFPAFALTPGDSRGGIDVQSDSATSTGVGDVLVRAKYVVRRGIPADLAIGLGLSLPSGRADDFQGTGTTLVQPQLILSRVLGDRVELLANAGIDLHTEDVARSVVRWALGGTVMVLRNVAVPIVFLGRHELAASADPIAVPFFFQIERSDRFDASVGLRWRFAEAGVVSANALVPIDRDGLRPDVIPTAGVEFMF